jgi:hypothetical protein
MSKSHYDTESPFTSIFKAKKDFFNIASYFFKHESLIQINFLYKNKNSLVSRTKFEMRQYGAILYYIIRINCKFSLLSIWSYLNDMSLKLKEN